MLTPAAYHAVVRGEARGGPAAALRAALWWARLPYGVGVGVRNALFDAGVRRPVRVPVPVVSVGNLTLGGTGKTPCVEWVCGVYRDLGRQVAVVSRGYGAAAGPNDEALVLEDNMPDVPHLQDPDRVAAALLAIDECESEEEDEDEYIPWDERPPVLAEKARLLFDATHPDVQDVTTTAVWAAGEILNFGGNFNGFITHKDLAKQEGLIFRHLLRMILLTDEFATLTPPGLDPADWQAELKDIADKLTEACRQVDPTSTEQTIKKAHAAADVVAGETAPPSPGGRGAGGEGDSTADSFAAGLVD